MTDVREEVAKKPFRFSSNPKDFLQGQSDEITGPFLLVDKTSQRFATFPTIASIPTDLLKSVKGVSFFGVVKALEEANASASDIGKNEWFLQRLRISGNEIKEHVNPDTQRVVLAILHGLHAYFLASDPTNEHIPPLLSQIPTRFQYVVDTFDAKGAYVQDTEHVLSILTRRYLNQREEDTTYTIRDLMEELKTPATFWNDTSPSSFFKQKTGKEPFAEQDIGLDTETVRDFYVAGIPLATSVLGY